MTANAKVLLVEDELIVATSIAQNLEKAGYKVAGMASSAIDALTSIEQDIPDLILMDIRIQGPVDGITTAEEIRNKYNLPIIFLSAHADRKTVERAKATEPFGYMVKPVSYASLMTAIEIALYKHARIRSLEERYVGPRSTDGSGRATANGHQWLEIGPYLAAIVDGSDDAIIGKDLNGIIVSWNRAAERMFGYSAQEAIGRPVSILAAPSVSYEMPLILADIRNGKPVARYETLRRHKNGREIPVLLTVSPIRDSTGRIVGASKIARDITDLKKTEQTLKQARAELELRVSQRTAELEAEFAERQRAEERFRLVVEAAPNAMIMVGADGCIALINSQTEKLFGYDRSELLGEPVERLVPQRFRGIYGAHRDSFFHAPTARSMGIGCDLFGVRKDGTEVPIEIGLNPIGSPDGNFVLASIIDITERKRAEERFRLVVEAAPNAMIMVAADGRVALINSQTEKLFGYDRSELLGEPVERLVPERFRGGDGTHRTSFFSAPMAPSMGVGRDLFGMRKDGTEVPIEIGLNPISSAEGNFVLASIIDITERKRAEERFRLVVEAAPNAMIMVGAEGRIKLINSQTEKLFGYDRRELLGEPVERLVPEGFRRGHSGHRSAFFSAPTARSMGVGRDLFGVRKDGTEVPIEIGLNPISSPEGNFVLASIIDITERKRAEEHFRLVVEAAPNAMIMVGSDGRIALINSQTEKLFGYDRSELLGETVERLVPERLRGGHGGHRSAFFSAPTARSMGVGRDLFGVRKDGTEVPIEILLNPISSPEGSFVLASIIDITERKIAENDLKRSLNEKLALLQEVHHRVKNNLYIISSLLSMQANTMEDQDIVAKLQDSERRVMSMAMIHEQLYQNNDMSSIDLAEYVSDLAAQLFSSYAPNQSISYRLETVPTSLTIEQSIPCGLILNELITNALKYAYPNGQGEIVVRVLAEQDSVTMTVSDLGAGLPADFNRKRSKSLGMKIIEVLTTQLQGQLTIESPPGASFTVCFVKRRLENLA